MNSLETYIITYNEEEAETEILNDLQNHGIISDNCIWAAEVAEVDAIKAVEWLRKRKKQ